MSSLAGLILVLANQGHWFGGQAQTVSVQWATENPPVEAVVTWDLLMGEVRLGGDRVALDQGRRPATINITLPEVRVRTDLQLVLRLAQREPAKDLGGGTVPIWVYPTNLLSGAAKRVAKRQIVVWDRPEGIPKTLNEAHIPHRRIDGPAVLQAASCDIILVGHDQIDEGPFAQTALLGHAESGVSVMIFEQRRPSVLAGYSLVRRKVPASLAWRGEHLLFNGFRQADLAKWPAGWAGDLKAIQLPADAPVLELAYWPRESPGREPAPIDALVVTKTIGAGRIVLCQVPLGGWDADPRSQCLLANALEYLSTRPEPTLPPSRRRVVPVQGPTTVPTITIPPGAKP